MIRVVLDTNIIISGTLWSGTPSRVIQAIEQGKVKPIASEAMLDELQGVLERPKFTKRLELIGKTAKQVVSEYAARAEVIEVQPLGETVSEDPDDDIFIACTISGKAQMVISGDPHLLDVKQYQGIPILNVVDFLKHLSTKD